VEDGTLGVAGVGLEVGLVIGLEVGLDVRAGSVSMVPVDDTSSKRLYRGRLSSSGTASEGLFFEIQ